MIPDQRENDNKCTGKNALQQPGLRAQSSCSRLPSSTRRTTLHYSHLQAPEKTVTHEFSPQCIPAGPALSPFKAPIAPMTIDYLHRAVTLCRASGLWALWSPLTGHSWGLRPLPSISNIATRAEKVFLALKQDYVK